MAKFRKAVVYIMTAVCVLTLIAATVLIAGTVPAYAATDGVEYTNVLDDLAKDDSFNVANYPTEVNSKELRVIQIAESSDKELFIYTYQPAAKCVASSINISRTINDAISPKNYKLELLNSNGVFYKYIVKDFAVSDDPTRYYVIPSILRPFEDGDEETGNGNTISEVPYEVGKQYCFGTINGKPYCNVVDVETITITDKFVGFVRYSDGYLTFYGACDSHFVAFNTDKPMDRLMEADVYYTRQDYTISMTDAYGLVKRYGDVEECYAYPTYKEKVEHEGNGFAASKYTWDRIETVEQFLAENDLTQNVYSGAIIDVKVASKITDEGKAALSGKKWVLRFTETAYSFAQHSMQSFSEQGTLVGDVMILRLKFETDGIVYNLGVVDNKQTGSKDPINSEEVDVDVTFNVLDWFSGSGGRLKKIAAIILLVLLLLLVLFLVRIIAVPFRLIGSGVKSIKKSIKKRNRE